MQNIIVYILVGLALIMAARLAYRGLRSLFADGKAESSNCNSTSCSCCSGGCAKANDDFKSNLKSGENKT